MVQSKDLRVGNWVQDEHGIIQYVYRIWQEGVELSADATGIEDLDYESKELFGIPLTNEILKKCGFKEDIDGDFIIEYTRIALIVVEGLENDWLVRYRQDVGIPYMAFNINTPMNYLHQLQNLYYCLTGDELQYAC